MGAKASSESFNMAASFISSLSIGLPAIMISQVTLPVLQIDNDRKRAIVAALSLGITNIVLVIISVSFTNLGMFGIGLSTSISFYISLIISLFHFKKKEKIFKIQIIKKRLPEKFYIKQILFQGLPYAVANFCNALFILYMNYLLLNINNEDAVAAFTIINALTLVCISIGTCLGSTTLLTANFLYGEKNKEMLIDLIKTFLVKSFFYNIFVIVLINLFCENIVLLFTDSNNEIFNTIVYALRLYSISLVFYSICSCFRNLIQGSGNLLLKELLNQDMYLC